MTIDIHASSGNPSSTDALSGHEHPDGGAIPNTPPCYCAGTRILTPGGYVEVEKLSPGDTVVTVGDAGPEICEIIWTGKRSVDLARHADREKVMPVRISAGAVGAGLPLRDLRVSPDHALYLDRHLIEAKNLVNGVTIVREPEARRVTYHHVELASHAIMLAEGLPAETYLDTGNRMMFDGPGPIVLHPNFGGQTATPDLALQSRAQACAPLALEGDVVAAVRQRLLDRALRFGYSATEEIDVMARADGHLLTVRADGTDFSVEVPAGARFVELISSAGVPAEVCADPRDRRRLGVAVARLALLADGERIEIPLDGSEHGGLYDLESSAAGNFRWTNGLATIALPGHPGAVLEISLLGQAKRWVEVEREAVAV